MKIFTGIETAIVAFASPEGTFVGKDKEFSSIDCVQVELYTEEIGLITTTEINGRWKKIYYYSQAETMQMFTAYMGYPINKRMLITKGRINIINEGVDFMHMGRDLKDVSFLNSLKYGGFRKGSSQDIEEILWKYHNASVKHHNLKKINVVDVARAYHKMVMDSAELI